jgi:nitrogen fixation protein FixH
VSTNTNTEPHPKGRPWLWPSIIIGALVVHTTALVVFVFIATRDPSFAVEPNSYQKALSWDGSAARLRASQQLGWKVSFQVGTTPDMFGKRQLVCRIVDKDGVAVVGADVQLLLFHHARAANRVHVSLSPEKDGTYAAPVPMKRPGLWEFRVAVRRGDNLYSAVMTQEVGSV